MADTAGLQIRTMLRLFSREATYNAGGGMSSAEACELSGLTGQPRKMSDELLDDGGDQTGVEQPTHQEILVQGLEWKYQAPKARPNELAGIAGLACGSIVSTQDGALAAYRHKITRGPFDGPILSTRMEQTVGTQCGFNGICCKKLTIKGEQKGPVSLEADLIGSGHRAASAAAYAAKVAEGWLLTPKMKVWLETGATRQIAATPTQNAQNISSGAAIDIKDLIESFTFEYDTGMELVYGFGGDLVAAYPRYGADGRKASLSFTLKHRGVDTQLDYFRNQTKLAIEFDLTSGTLIAAGGTFYYGMSLIIPSFQIKPVDQDGARGNYVTQKIEATILEDGFNAEPFYLYVYNTKAAYLAA